MKRNTPALQAKDGSEIRRGRISPALRTAVELIVRDGLTQRQAAERVGYQEHSIQRALQKPHVRALMSDVKRAELESRTLKAWTRVEGLAEGAASEKVRLEANRTILQGAGELVPEPVTPPQTAPLIQFIRSETHYHGDQHAPPPIPERMPGVFQLSEDDYEVRRSLPDWGEG